MLEPLDDIQLLKYGSISSHHQPRDGAKEGLASASPLNVVADVSPPRCRPEHAMPCHAMCPHLQETSLLFHSSPHSVRSRRYFDVVRQENVY